MNSFFYRTLPVPASAYANNWIFSEAWLKNCFSNTMLIIGKSIQIMWATRKKFLTSLVLNAVEWNETVASALELNQSLGLLNGSTSRCVYLASKVSKFKDFSGPYFPIFELNTDIYSLSLRIQYEYGKILTRKTSNSGTFHTVIFNNKINSNNTLIFYKLWTSQGSKIKITLTYLRI